MMTGTDNNDEQPLVNDEIADNMRRERLVTNDAVAGETVLPGADAGDTGGPGDPERPVQPEYGPEDPIDPQTIDLDTERDDEKEHSEPEG